MHSYSVACFSLPTELLVLSSCSVQVDKERQSQLDARKDRRATGEIEGLRERLRAMENRDKEKEDEMKQLKRNLRQKELSLLSSGATSVADR